MKTKGSRRGVVVLASSDFSSAAVAEREYNFNTFFPMMMENSENMRILQSAGEGRKQ
jgi:hypothetical protein